MMAMTMMTMMMTRTMMTTMTMTMISPLRWIVDFLYHTQRRFRAAMGRAQ